MKNYVQEGDILDMVAPAGGFTSGQGALIGGLFVVATKAAAEGEALAVSLKGVFNLPKATGSAMIFGQKAYWTGTQITGTASGNTLVGCVAARDGAAADATSVNVRISN